MEYLQPLKNLEKRIVLYRNLLLASGVCLALSLTAMPFAALEGNPIVVQYGDTITLAKKEPWKFSVTRIESFMKSYLSARFEWDESNFEQKRTSLQMMVSDKVFLKLKDSLSAFESINKSQKAKSFYILEGFGFSNEKHKIEAHVTRVLRIQKLAVATPLIIQIEFRDSAITESNPYGLEVSGLKEAEVY